MYRQAEVYSPLPVRKKTITIREYGEILLCLVCIIAVQTEILVNFHFQTPCACTCKIFLRKAHKKATYLEVEYEGKAA